MSFAFYFSHLAATALKNKWVDFCNSISYLLYLSKGLSDR